MAGRSGRCSRRSVLAAAPIMRVLLTAQFAGERNRLYLALSAIMLMNLPPKSYRR